MIKIDSITTAFFCITSLIALIFALILEYGFHFSPCRLCIYERWPFFLVFLLSAVMLVRPQVVKLFIPIIFLLYFLGIGIVIYHIGVEHHIFRLTESCGLYYDHMDSIDKLYNQIISHDIVRCDRVNTVFGISLTYLTMLYFCLSNLIGYILYRKYG